MFLVFIRNFFLVFLSVFSNWLKESVLGLGVYSLGRYLLCVIVVFLVDIIGSLGVQIHPTFNSLLTGERSRILIAKFLYARMSNVLLMSKIGVLFGLLDDFLYRKILSFRGIMQISKFILRLRDVFRNPKGGCLSNQI